MIAPDRRSGRAMRGARGLGLLWVSQVGTEDEVEGIPRQTGPVIGDDHLVLAINGGAVTRNAQPKLVGVPLGICHDQYDRPEPDFVGRSEPESWLWCVRPV